MVEQGTHKPLDVGSNPTLATMNLIGSTCLLQPLSEKNKFLIDNTPG
jgi:hypothetical protein